MLPGFRIPTGGNLLTMLRKLLWTIIYGFFGAIAAIAARTAASKVYRIVTGEVPPAKK